MKGEPLLFPEAVTGTVTDISAVYGRILKPLGVDVEKLVRRTIKKYLELERPLRASWGAAKSKDSCKAVATITRKLMRMEIGDEITVEPRYHSSRLQSNIRSARKRVDNENLAFYIARGVNETVIRRIEDGTRWARPVRANWKMGLLARMVVGETIVFPSSERLVLETYLKVGARQTLGDNNAEWKQNARSGELKVTRVR